MLFLFKVLIIIINLRHCCIVKKNFLINQNFYKKTSMIDKLNFAKYFIKSIYVYKSFILIIAVLELSLLLKCI